MTLDYEKYKQQRILAVTYGRDKPKLISKKLRQMLPNGSEIILVGNKRTELILSGLVRIKKRKGKVKQLFEFGKYFNCSTEQISDKELDNAVFMAVDHIQRRSLGFTWDYHSLDNLPDTKHYYHIVFDMLSTFLISKKINQIIFFDLPHLFYDTLLYQVAKLKGIKTLIVTFSHFDNKFFSFQSLHEFGIFPVTDDFDHALPYLINPSELPSWKYMEGIKQHPSESGSLCWRGVLQLLINLGAAEPSKLFDVKFLKSTVRRMRKISSALPKWRYPFLRYFHSSHLDYYETLLNFEDTDLDLNRKFVYFPLQYQPEMTTSTLGGVFSDQLLAIEQIARILPEDCSIYVKENPKQTGRMRSSIFFHRLFRVSNVKVLPSYANTYELIDKSQFVATITGTVGWEAICRGKNVLTFGLCWYRNLTGVFHFREDLTFDDLCTFKVDHKLLEYQVSQLYSRTHSGDIYEPVSNATGKVGIRREQETDSVAETILELIQNRIDCTFPSLSQ